jgi:hypothetical protein
MDMILKKKLNFIYLCSPSMLFYPFYYVMNAFVPTSFHSLPGALRFMECSAPRNSPCISPCNSLYHVPHHVTTVPGLVSVTRILTC